ncbi:MAG: hypothetical protein ABGX40_02325 [Methylococcales bacterium]|jgi:hypothetical protein
MHKSLSMIGICKQIKYGIDLTAIAVKSSINSVLCHREVTDVLDEGKGA